MRKLLDLDGQIAAAKTYQERLGARYIGWRKGKNCNEFGFSKEGFEDRWIVLSSLRAGNNPFNQATIGEQELEAKSYEKKFGAKYIGWNGKKGNKSKFSFSKEGFEDRWIALGHLREGKSPFHSSTIGEQEAEAKSYEKELDAKYIGYKQESGRNTKFGFAKDGFEDRWTTLAGLRRGQNTFHLATIGEQELEAKSYEKELGAEYIGQRKVRGKDREFGFSKEGFENRWIILSGLRDGHNPFVDGGFNVNEVGYLYILLVIVGAEQYIKFGITNNDEKRMKDHTKSLNKVAGQWSQLHIKRFENGQKCLDFETNLKRQFWPKRVNLGIDGFKNECFHHSIKDTLFSQVL